jgi:hypothetical protein
MASTTRRGATYADLLEVPDHKVAEIVDGEMHVSPRPSSRHALAAAGLDRAVEVDLAPLWGGPAG